MSEITEKNKIESKTTAANLNASYCFYESLAWHGHIDVLRVVSIVASSYNIS